MIPRYTILLIVVTCYIMPLCIIKYDKLSTLFDSTLDNEHVDLYVKIICAKIRLSFATERKSNTHKYSEYSEYSESSEPIFIRYTKHVISRRPKFMTMNDHTLKIKTKHKNIVSTSLIVRTIGHLIRYETKSNVIIKSDNVVSATSTDLIVRKPDHLVLYKFIIHQHKIENTNKYNNFSVWMIIYHINDCNSQNNVYIINVTDMIIDNFNGSKSFSLNTLTDTLTDILTDTLQSKSIEKFKTNNKRFLPGCDRWSTYLFFVFTVS